MVGQSCNPTVTLPYLQCCERSELLLLNVNVNVKNKTEENRGLHRMQHQFIVNSGECSHHCLYQPVEGDKVPVGAHKYIKNNTFLHKLRLNEAL